MRVAAMNVFTFLMLDFLVMDGCKWNNDSCYGLHDEKNLMWIKTVRMEEGSEGVASMVEVRRAAAQSVVDFDESTRHFFPLATGYSTVSQY